MIADHDFGLVLDYAAALERAATAIEGYHAQLDETVDEALLGWRGGLALEMRTVRSAEALADSQIAAANLRAEAERWAALWAAEVDRRNLAERDEARRVIDATVASFTEPAAYPIPETTLPFPEPAPVPVGPFYPGGRVFAEYVRVADFEWGVEYRWSP